MQSPATPDPDNEETPAKPSTPVISKPDFSGPSRPIGELTERVNFPRCALGVHVNIKGFDGVVVEIINQSIKVVSHDGIKQRFNVQRLKTLFAPPVNVKPQPRNPAGKEPVVEKTKPRVYIAKPDFTAPVRAIRTYAIRPDFPKCAYGKHVDIPGYSGVVVEIVKGSLKVQCLEGTTRSYNCEALRKLYGKA